METTGPRSISGGTLLWLALAVGVLVWSVSSRFSPGSASPAVLLLLLAAAALELTSARLPGAGFAGAGFAACLGAADLAGAGWGCAIAALGLGLRTLLRTRAGFGLGLAEAAADAAPSMLGLAAYGEVVGTGGVPAALGVTVLLLLPMRYLVPALAYRIPDEELRRRWERARVKVMPGFLATPFLGYLLAHGLRESAWNAMLWIPVIGAVQLAFLSLVVESDKSELELLKKQRDRNASELEKAEEALRGAREDLQKKHDEYLTLESLARRLRRSESFRETAELLVEIARDLVACDTVALFCPDKDGGLYPFAFRGHGCDRLQNARLLQLREPVVESVYRHGGAEEILEPLLGEERLLQDINSGMAVCLGPDGVVYAGRLTSAPLEPRERQWLLIAAGQAALALQAARRQEEKASALHEAEASRTELQEWSEGLLSLLDGTRSMVSSLERDRLLDQLEITMRTMVPHTSRVIAAVEDGALRVLRSRLEELPASPGPALGEVVGALLEGGRPLLFEDVTTSRFGPVFPDERSLLAVPIPSDTGPGGALLVSHRRPGSFRRLHQDLLVLLAFQAAVAFLNARLHSQTIEAYRKLQESESQLIQSSKLAAVGQLAAGVAHELNTPLASVLLAMDAASLAMAKNPERARQKLEQGSQEVLRAQGIVENLLYYSRDGRQGTRPTALKELIADTLELVGYQLTREGITIHLVDTETPRVTVNRNEIQQVIINLLLNARDALAEHPRDQRHVYLRTRRNGPSAELEVEDSGPGVPADIQGQVFDPFFTTKPVGRGTGLGLSISRQIATNHGGNLELRSPGPRGAKFLLKLPILEEEPVHAP
ncbi:MAG: hypothetical protein HY319_18110 [Armatimonadetes bacterium]|nr:hypothetical protein [Armatimonadota bacterium]